MANIVVFMGSVRNERQGHHVGAWVSRELQERGHDVRLVDPLDYDELLVMRERYKFAKNPSKAYTELKETIVEADGFIVITPEYNHSYSGAIKNALDCFLEEFYFRPFGIITYSGGSFGGIRAAEHLRAVIAELGCVSIPISLPVSKVQGVFNTDGALVDDAYNKRLDRMVNEFEWYMSALAAARKQGVPY